MSKALRLNRVKTACVLIALVLFFPGLVSSDSIGNTPQKCVSLKEGQLCTQRIVIEWAALNRGDYCVFTDRLAEPLSCWEASLNGQLRVIYKDNVDWVFTLRPKGQEIVLATSTMSIAWVYKNRRRSSGWRTFWKLF